PPLYYVLEHASISLLGVRPLPLRALSILLFLISLPVIRTAGEAWFDARTGRLAVILCGLNPLHLFFGFAARWYSLLFLCVAILLASAGKIANTLTNATPALTARGGRIWPAVWIVAAAATCYTNYLGPVIVALLWLWGVATGRGGWRNWNRML